MSGWLPVRSLRISTSSLACFCHKLLFGSDLICPATCAAFCRPGTNLQLGSNIFFLLLGIYNIVNELHQCFSGNALLSAALYLNFSCLLVESSRFSTASKTFWLYNLELNSFVKKKKKTLKQRAAPSA